MKNPKLFIVTLLLLTNSLKTFACGPCYENEAYQFYLFQPYITNNPDAYMFYYNPYSYYNEHLVPKTIGPIENLKEWKSYFNNEVNLQEIDNLIYGFKLSNKRHNGAFGLYNLVLDLSKYKLSNYLYQQNNIDALSYILFAKVCESKLSYSGWDNDSYSSNKNLKTLCESLKESTSDTFLNYRYSYQNIVIEYYNKNSIKAMYKDMSKKYPNKILTEWAKFFQNTPENLSEENIISLAEVFENCDYKKLRISTIFPKKESELYKNAYKIANNTQKAALLAIYEFRNKEYDVKTLEKIYQLNPNSKLLPFLITREINKIEEHFYSYEIHSSSFYNVGKLDNYWDKSTLEQKKSDKKAIEQVKLLALENLSKLNNLLQLCVNSSESTNPFYNIAFAYTQSMGGNNLNCKKQLQIAEQKEITYLMEKQINIIEVTNSFNINSYNSNEYAYKLNSILKDSSYLNNYYSFNDYYDENYNIKTHHNNLVLFLMYKLIKNNKIAHAGLLQSVNDYTTYYQSCTGFNTENYFFFFENHVPLKQIREVIKIIEKENKTDFENLICKNINKNILYDLEGTLLMRENNFSQAIISFSKIDTGYFNHDTLRYGYPGYFENYMAYIDCNPFHAYFNEIHTKKPEYDTVKYNKLEFAIKMNNLQKKENNLNDNKKDIAWNYFIMANAYYNMTHYGNSWAYSRYHSSSSYLERDEWPYTYNNEEFKKNYYECSKAIEYYTKALNKTTSKSFKALCLRMLGKCETLKTNKKWNHYDQELIDNYPLHKKLISNCESIDDYLTAFKQ